ncbi:rhodanese-like domain-containing protein, partial [Planococcus sp. SIMBA_143]
VQWHEIDPIVENGGTLIDVRNPSEFKKGYINGAINIPVDELRSKLHELPQDETIYVHCQVGLRGYIATRILRENGFHAFNLDGGYR